MRSILTTTLVFACAVVAQAQVFVPAGLNAGDPYHLAFITQGARDATSTESADYNAFVQAEAEREGAVTAGWGIDWFALVSTDALDARDNALLGGPVYRLDGLLVSPTDLDGNTIGLWQAYIGQKIAINQFGQQQESIVWTGSTEGGTNGGPNGSFHLGDHEWNLALTGTTNPSSPEEWMFRWRGHEPLTNEHPLYAISELLIDGRPVPLLAGDYNSNGQVEQGDLDLVLGNWVRLEEPGITYWRLPPRGWLFDPPTGRIAQAELDQVLLTKSDIVNGKATAKGPLETRAFLIVLFHNQSRTQ